MVAINEEWLSSVGFKWRPPEERQPFKHWTLKFNEPDDYGLYIETTMPGWLNSNGEHIAKEHGWFLWLGRETHCFMHLRHVHEQSEIIAIVEAITGLPWEPTKQGMVKVKPSVIDPTKTRRGK